MKKKLLFILMIVFAVAITMVGCDATPAQSPSPTAQDNAQIRAVYELYSAQAQANGQTPLSYEDWLAGIRGQDGANGLSAYEIWLNNGNVGTEQDFLNWLKGEPGATGAPGTPGANGLSAYEIWLNNGNEGTEEDFLNWLKGSLCDHEYGAWRVFTADDVDCSARMFFCVCTKCNEIKWRQGTADDHVWDVVVTEPTYTTQGFTTKTCEVCGKVETCDYTDPIEHPWQSEYTTDDTWHWIKCATCTATKDKAEHVDNGEGVCEICDKLIGATEGVQYDLSADRTYAEVIGYTGTATRVHIADTYNGVPVTSIYDSAFKNSKITEVVIPDSVTTIGYRAFYWCTRLTSVTIGDSVATIGSSAFYYCTSLTSVTIPDSVTSIADDAFAGCNNVLKEYEGLQYLSTTTNDYFAVVGIANENLSTYTIHKDTKFVIAGFYVCERMTNIVIPDSVTTIGEYAFYNCDSLISVTIGDGVTTIGEYAFFDCYGLTSVTIGDSVATIGSSAFYYCPSLTSVTIGDGVTTIGDNAFAACGSLTELNYEGTKEQWGKISLGFDWEYGSAIIRIICTDGVIAL